MTLRQLVRLRELIGFRGLIFNFVLRDVKEKYRGSLLGYFWTLITPLLLMTVFMLIFTYVFPVNIPYFPLYLLTGLLSWNFFSSSLQESVWSIKNGGELLKKVYFLGEVYPLSIVVTNLITFCLSLLVLVPFLIGYQIHPSWRIGLLPLIIVWQALFCCGLCMIGSLLHVFFRDTGHLLTAGLNIWFYASPIFYTTGFMSEKVRMIYMFNPTAVMIELYRWSLLNNPLPDPIHLAAFGIDTVLVLVIGLMVFQRKGTQIVKVL